MGTKLIAFYNSSIIRRAEGILFLSFFLLFCVCLVCGHFIFSALVNMAFLPVIAVILLYLLAGCFKLVLNHNIPRLTVLYYDFSLCMVMVIFLYTLWIINDCYIFNAGLLSSSLAYGLFEVKIIGVVNYVVAADGLALLFIFLTNFLALLCVYVSIEFVKMRYLEFIIIFLILQAILLQFFINLNLVFFYIAFEAVLIPMFFIIGIWGSRSRKIFAAYVFFLYTLIGSLFMLVGIIYLANNLPDLNYFTLVADGKERFWISPYYQRILFILFFIGFAVKIPMFPAHVWLPEAHVEAPTLGSVVLAGILLKLGGHGMVRFLLDIFPFSASELRNVLFVTAVISVVYSAFIGLCQLDLKKIVAYSSITHMNFSVAGLFCGDDIGVVGAIYSMFSHGLISAALFLLVGILYERYKTRLFAYYGGLASLMPFFSIFFFYFIIANVGFPPLSGFVSELLILIGLMRGTGNILVVLLIFASSILLVINFFWLFNRVSMGPVSGFIEVFQDLTVIESSSLSVLAVFVALIGLSPESILFFLRA